MNMVRRGQISGYQVIIASYVCPSHASPFLVWIYGAFFTPHLNFFCIHPDARREKLANCAVTQTPLRREVTAEGGSHARWWGGDGNKLVAEPGAITWSHFAPWSLNGETARQSMLEMCIAWVKLCFCVESEGLFVEGRKGFVPFPAVSQTPNMFPLSQPSFRAFWKH